MSSFLPVQTSQDLPAIETGVRYRTMNAGKIRISYRETRRVLMNSFLRGICGMCR
jgi:hypothetical protein